MQKNPNVLVKKQKNKKKQQQQQSRSKKHTIPCKSFSQEILVPNKKKILVLLVLLLLLLLLPVIIMILEMLFLFCQLQIASLHSLLPFPLPRLHKQHTLFLSRKHFSLPLSLSLCVYAVWRRGGRAHTNLAPRSSAAGHDGCAHFLPSFFFFFWGPTDVPTFGQTEITVLYNIIRAGTKVPKGKFFFIQKKDLKIKRGQVKDLGPYIIHSSGALMLLAQYIFKLLVRSPPHCQYISFQFFFPINEIFQTGI